jgi:hypothetical protein
MEWEANTKCDNNKDLHSSIKGGSLRNRYTYLKLSCSHSIFITILPDGLPTITVGLFVLYTEEFGGAVAFVMSKAIHREKVARHVSVVGEIAVHEALLEGRFHGRRRVWCTPLIISFFRESCVVAWEVFRLWKDTYAPLHLV